ncbi:MAG: ABC transporter permease subunit [Proteobacteria bacterium]|nr:ABC transporter permease subunit [Pseudomonadota bacterium]
MTEYLLRRLLLIIPTFLGITMLVFIVTRFVPGGPIEKLILSKQMGSMDGKSSGMSSTSGRASQGTLSEEQLEQLNAYYGFDKPVITAYFIWLGKVLQFDLGNSTRYGEPVWDSIKSRLPISAFYGFSTMLITYLICIPLGVLKAVRHKTWFDNISSIFVFIGYAIPGYVVGILLMVVFASKLEWLPMGKFISDGFEDLTTPQKILDVIRHAVLPLTAYVVGSFALMTFMMKNNLLDQLSSDYVRTAIAKGCSYRRAVVMHAFRNSLIPLATNFGNNIAFLLSGSFLIEKIFNIDGMGLLGYESIVERDYPIVMGVLVISALLQLTGNILSDICVAIVDPRIQFR